MLVWLLFQATSASAAPIPSVGPPPSLPAFKGSAVPARPTGQVTNAPQNPFLALDPNSNIHNDTWMTDAYQRLGPLGNSLVATSSGSTPSLCGSLTFDSRHRIVSVCPSIVAPPQARIIDPRTLATIATYTLPTAPDPPGTKAYQNFTGGGYFFLDQTGPALGATKTDHIFVIAESPDGTSLVKKRDFDLTGVLDESTERITSALPDFSGRIWFVSKKSGKVGTIDPAHRQDSRDAPRGGDRELLRGRGRTASTSSPTSGCTGSKRAKNGAPRIVWKAGYPNSGIVKPSQVDAGSGTTPTIMSGHYVAITDNADPMDVVVYRTRPHLPAGQQRRVCTVPVFKKGASATENSLLTAGRALIVENNYGYQDPFGPNGGRRDRAGLRPSGRLAERPGMHEGLGEPRRPRSHGGPEALHEGRAHLHLHAPARPERFAGLLLDCDSFYTGRTVWRRYAARACPTTTTTPAWRSAPTGRSTSGRPAGCLPAGRLSPG